MKIVPKTKIDFPLARVVVNFMHGDADADTRKEYNFKSYEMAGAFVGNLVILKEIDCHDVYKSAQEAATKYDIPKNMILDVYYGIVPADCTNDEYRAKIKNIEVYGMTVDGWYEFEIVEE